MLIIKMNGEEYHLKKGNNYFKSGTNDLLNLSNGDGIFSQEEMDLVMYLDDEKFVHVHYGKNIKNDILDVSKKVNLFILNYDGTLWCLSGNSGFGDGLLEDKEVSLKSSLGLVKEAAEGVKEEVVVLSFTYDSMCLEYILECLKDTNIKTFNICITD